MDWWIKLKEMVTGSHGGGGRIADRKDPRLPSYIMALCQVNEASAFSVEITGLSVSGMKLHTPRRIPSNSDVFLRVPVGVNFEDRETNEYVSFTARSVWTQRANGGGFETGVRYLEGENEKRDRWVHLVLQSYGMSLGDDRRSGEVRKLVHLPVWLRQSDDTEVAGEVLNISTGGLQVQVDGPRLRSGDHVGIEFRPPAAPLCLAGQVVHAHEEGAQARLYGLAFDALSEPQRKQLLDMITNLSREAVAAHALEPVPHDEDEPE